MKLNQCKLTMNMCSLTHNKGMWSWMIYPCIMQLNGNIMNGWMKYNYIMSITKCLCTKCMSWYYQKNLYLCCAPKKVRKFSSKISNVNLSEFIFKLCVLVKKYRCMFCSCEGQGHSKALVCILHCMVVRVCQRRRKVLNGGIWRWFRGPADVRWEALHWVMYLSISVCEVWYIYGLRSSSSPLRGEVFGHMVLLEKVNAHLVNDGSLNPYFQGWRGSVNDIDFSLPKKCLISCFPQLCVRNTLGWCGTLSRKVCYGRLSWGGLPSSPLECPFKNITQHHVISYVSRYFIR